MVCSNVSPAPRRDRSGRSRPARARRAGREAWPARRLRGAGLGPSYQRLSRRLGSGPAADHPAVGLMLDSFHILARKTTPVRSVRIPGDRIFLVQMADAPFWRWTYLSWSRHFRNFPGQGDLPIRFMAAVATTGYDGFCRSRSSTTSSGRVRAQRRGRRAAITDLSADRLAARLERPIPGAARLPARARALGAEFVEFAVDEESGPELEKCLRLSASAAPAGTLQGRRHGGVRATSIS